MYSRLCYLSFDNILINLLFTQTEALFSLLLGKDKNKYFLLANFNQENIATHPIFSPEFNSYNHNLNIRYKGYYNRKVDYKKNFSWFNQKISSEPTFKYDFHL